LPSKPGCGGEGLRYGSGSGSGGPGAGAGAGNAKPLTGNGAFLRIA